VTNQSPWGPPSGIRLRSNATIAGLERVGELTIVTIQSPAQPAPAAPEGTKAFAVDQVRYPPSKGRYLLWLLVGRRPPSLLGYSARRSVEDVVGFLPDLVWYQHAASFESLDRPRSARTVIDLNDLEDRRDEHVRQARSEARRWSGRLRRAFDTFASWRLRRAWARYYAERHDDGVVLVTCSRQDADHVGEAVWAPNGYPVPAQSTGRPERGTEKPDFLFVGRLTYRPNQDAVDELLTVVWPAISDAIPAAQLSIVGAGSERWSKRQDGRSVHFAGEVPSIEPFLSRSTAILLPIRSGGGTRLKVLEAFAHRVPVIATRVAVEGLDAVDGIHYLAAETPEEFVTVAQRIVTSMALRVSLTEQDHAHFLQHYSYESSVDAFERIAGDQLARHADSSR
jgi:glycosyltransferase involved in cell wall biosynthesis